jgi:Spy/CpxP family protein refolding chaperone
MNLSHRSIALYVALVFACGITLGVFGQRLYTASSVNAKAVQTKGPVSFKVRYVEESQRRLNLTDEQVTKLVHILDETRARMDEYNVRMVEPEMLRIRNEQVEKIRAMLTPEQVLEYEKLRQERDDRAKAKAALKTKK